MNWGLRLAECAFALFGLAFMSGTLSMLLAAEPGAISSPLIQVTGAAIGFYSFVAIMLQRGAASRIMSLYWLALLPVFFAIASLIWTVNFEVTLRRAGALGLTTAFGFWLAQRFTPKQLFHLVALLVGLIIIANFAVIQLNPVRGVHQPYDILAQQHAGSWRGMLGHKNDFGRMMALIFCFLIVVFIFRVGGWLGRIASLPLFGLAGLMIVNSNSAQAALLFVVVPFALILLFSMSKVSPTKRALFILMVTPLAIIIATSAQEIMAFSLGLIGRDPSLTGRTQIWEATLLALENNIVFGGGYGAGWDVVAPRMTALLGHAPGHAHNGYLDLAADIGFFGLGLILAVMLWNTVVSFRNLMQGELPEISALALTVLIFSFVGNIAGSFIMSHNSIYWVLIVATYCQLKNAARERSSLSSSEMISDGPYEAKQWVT